MTNQGNDEEDDDADSTISNSSSAAEDEALSIVSRPPVPMKQRRGVSTTPGSTSSTNTGRAGLVKATKVHLLQSHLHTLEKLQIEAAAQQKEKHVRHGQLALTVELKTGRRNVGHEEERVEGF
jgi:hypothetical protein